MSLHPESLAKLTLIIPVVVVLLSSAAGIPMLARRRQRSVPHRWFEALTFAGSLLSLLVSTLLLARPLEERSLLFRFLIFDLLVDPLSVYFIFLVNVIAAFASWNAFTSPPRQRRLFFNNLVNLFHFTMLLVPLVDNLVWLWIAVEATTLVSTLLVSFLGEKNAWEAAWKYLIVTSTGIIFALLGTILLANAATDLPKLPVDRNAVMNWSFLMENATALTPSLVHLSFLFILVGYGTKAGFAPMHTWLPDGHGEAPAPISALLSGVLLKSALYAILRFAALVNRVTGSSSFTSDLLLATGLLSLVLATPFILQERNRFKRVLAYHSLEHMGIIAFGLGVGGEIALFGALLHTLNHALTKSLMFLAFGNVMRRFAERGLDQTHISNVLRRMPLTGGVLALGGLALVGMPPFNIFLSELFILMGALPVEGQRAPAWLMYVAVFLFVISTTLIFFGLIRHLARVLMQRGPDLDTQPPGHETVRDERLPETFGEALPLVILATLVVVTGLVIWPPLAEVLKQSVEMLVTR